KGDLLVIPVDPKAAVQKLSGNLKIGNFVRYLAASRLNCVFPEEMEKLEKIALDNSILTEEFMDKYDNNILEIKISDNVSFYLTRNNFLNEFIAKLKEIKYNLKITNALDEIWNMSDLSEVITTKEDPHPDIKDMIVEQFGEVKSDRIRGILQIMVTQKYSTDDVIDRISNTGFESLNELNKYILENK
ncbi:MAG: hypothetical protein AABY22_20015, partial [Nanoarchaeota archaeon]